MLKLLHTTRTVLIGKHEVLLWDNGSIEIEDLARNFEEDDVQRDRLDHICLDETEQARLYMILHAKFNMKDERA